MEEALAGADLGAGQELGLKAAEYRYSYEKSSILIVSSSMPIGVQPGNCEISKFLPKDFYFDTFVYAHYKKCQ